MLRMTQRRRFRIRSPLFVALICMMQHVQPFSIRGHQPILDPVMDHLHEVSGARRSAVQVTLRRRARINWPSRCWWNRITSRRERLEDRIEMSDNVLLTTDHLAVTALGSPNTTARSDVDVMNTFSAQLL